jgi:hypothetical protein
MTYSILPGSQETVLRLAQLVDCVGFVDVIEVGGLVEVAQNQSPHSPDHGQCKDLFSGIAVLGAFFVV